MDGVLEMLEKADHPKLIPQLLGVANSPISCWRLIIDSQHRLAIHLTHI